MLLNLCDLFYYVKAPEYFTLLVSVLKINKVSALGPFFFFFSYGKRVSHGHSAVSSLLRRQRLLTHWAGQQLLKYFFGRSRWCYKDKGVAGCVHNAELPPLH